MPSIPVLSGSDAERWIAARAEPAWDEDARAAVGPILSAVRDRGDEALRELSRRFDGVVPIALRARREDLGAALANLAVERRRALEAAWANIERFHRVQVRDETPVAVRPGLSVWREFRPIERVGIYVPGGRAGYPSSLLMCGVPARIAGCPEIVVCSPPGPDGRVAESVLATAELLEIDLVFAVGGAQAIAAMAFGTASIPRVDKIFGPGNRYVTAAKELVHGIVNVDMPAGPSEIVVLCDATARPAWVAADLISQAEHAADSLAVCITTDAAVAEAVAAALARQLEALPEPGAVEASLTASAICVGGDLSTAIDWVNALAPEHLSIVTADDEAVLDGVFHAGSIFLGSHSPVAAGDYAAGSNHVIPTGRRARAWSALSLDDFGRWMQVQRLTASGLAEVAAAARTLARWEGFEAHARALEIRFEEAQ